MKIVFGRWQDVIHDLGFFDGIFFDTYGEFYENLKEFHEFLGDHLKHVLPNIQDWHVPGQEELIHTSMDSLLQTLSFIKFIVKLPV